MNNLVCNRAQPVVKKAKKKQIKNEVDRLKQAEKKRRRLEKALATSAAIRSELEKKKQRKKEEQQKLDEEGAAIAEAVALHVLLGEDADETCYGLCSKDDRNGPWDHSVSGECLRSGKTDNLPRWERPVCSFEMTGWPCSAGASKFIWGGFGDEWTFSRGNIRGHFYEPESTYSVWESHGFSASVSAAEAISFLQITEDAHVGPPSCL